MDFAIELAAAEGWNPGIHDANCFYCTDPDGFFIGLLNGRIIGCISAVSYDGVFGFLGLYIIVPEYRGRGCSRLDNNFYPFDCRPVQREI